MEQEIIITVDSAGTVTHLVDHPLTEYPETATVARASHIEPLDPTLFLAFRLIRWVFGDESKMADWTRTWKCLWSVDLSPVGGPTNYPFRTRAEAIEYEIKWLNQNFLGDRKSVV